MGQLKDEQVEIDAMRAQLDLVTAERDNLRAQLLHTQRAFLMQQRELNVLQLEKVDRAIFESSGED